MISINFISSNDYKHRKASIKTNYETNYALIGLDDITVVSDWVPDEIKNNSTTIDEKHIILHPALSLLCDLADIYKENLTLIGKNDSVKLLKEKIDNYYSNFITAGFPINYDKYHRQLLFYIIEHFCRYGAEANQTEYLYENALLDFIKTRSTSSLQNMVGSYAEMEPGKDYEIPYREDSIRKIMGLIPYIAEAYIKQEKYSYKWLLEDIRIKNIYIEWTTEPYNYIGRYYMKMIYMAITDILKDMDVEYDLHRSVDDANNRKWIDLDTGEVKIPGIPIGRHILSQEQYIEEYRNALSKYENHNDKLEITDYICHDNQTITFIVNGLEIYLSPIYIRTGMTSNYPSGAYIAANLNLGHGDFWHTFCSYYQFTNEQYNDDDTLYFIKRRKELKDQGLKVNVIDPTIAYELIQKHLYDIVNNENISHLIFNKSNLPFEFKNSGIKVIHYRAPLREWEIDIIEDHHPLCEKDSFALLNQTVEDYRFLVIEDWINNVFGEQCHYPWGRISHEYDFDLHYSDTHISRLRIHYSYPLQDNINI